MREQMRAALLVVGDEAGAEVFRARCLQPLCQLAAGKIFTRGHGLMLLAQATGRPRCSMFSSSAANIALPNRPRTSASTGAIIFIASSRLAALAAMRTSTWPGRARTPTVGLLEFGDQMTDLVVDGALADADDLEDPIVNHFRQVELLTRNKARLRFRTATSFPRARREDE